MRPSAPPKAHVFICRPGFEEALRLECADRFGIQGDSEHRAAVTFPDSTTLPRYSDTVFARQVLPRALMIRFSDVDEAAKTIISRFDIMSKRQNRQSGRWTLHCYSVDDDDCLALAKTAGKKLLAHTRQKHAEFQKRFVDAQDFPETCKNPDDMILQIFTSAKGLMWFSIGSLHDGVHPYEGGFRRMKTLKGAPSRSASKLEEALLALGKHPDPGDTAVDLGAAPGGWSFVLARYGAIVQAIDHAKVDVNSFKNIKGSIEHISDNGLTFEPNRTVDWLVCDMVMPSKDTLRVLTKWQQKALMRHFVVNIKLSKSNIWPQTKQVLDVLKGFEWAQTRARQLIHDRNEITLFGSKHL